MTIHRRSLLTGLGAVICAPAIVRASSLMPVKAYAAPIYQLTYFGTPLVMDDPMVVYRYVVSLPDVLPGLLQSRWERFDTNTMNVGDREILKRGEDGKPILMTYIDDFKVTG